MGGCVSCQQQVRSVKEALDGYKPVQYRQRHQRQLFDTHDQHFSKLRHVNRVVAEACGDIPALTILTAISL